MSDESALASLRFHWGEAYTIWHHAGSKWCAGPRDKSWEVDEYPLRADTADELRYLMRADYRKLDRVPGAEQVRGEAREPDGDDADDDG